MTLAQLMALVEADPEFKASQKKRGTALDLFALRNAKIAGGG